MKTLDKDQALVLFSGGQDSTTVLAYALHHYQSVQTVGFDYGQRHRVELDCRLDVLNRLKNDFPDWASKLGKDQLLRLSTFSSLSPSALTDETAPLETGTHGLPTSFVPGRNLFFFHYAAVVAYHQDIGTLIGGMCETDYSGYPDCREATLNALNTTLNLGMDVEFDLITPLMHLSKAESWQMAFELGGAPLVSLIQEATHSCYKGERTELHEWGYGCGVCPACELRQKGYEAWRVACDPV